MRFSLAMQCPSDIYHVCTLWLVFHKDIKYIYCGLLGHFLCILVVDMLLELKLIRMKELGYILSIFVQSIWLSWTWFVLWWEKTRSSNTIHTASGTSACKMSNLYTMANGKYGVHMRVVVAMLISYSNGFVPTKQNLVPSLFHCWIGTVCDVLILLIKLSVPW